MATYYFDNVSGNDSYTSAQAQSQSTPWQTISKFNSYFSSLSPGDTVSFKRGGVFYGGLVISRSGASGSPITLTSYGSGSLPILTGYTTITSWTAHPTASGVYQSPVSPPSVGYYMGCVQFQGVAKEMGRYPNSGNFLNYESTSPAAPPFFGLYGFTETVTDNQLPSSPSWVGAEIVMRRNVFVWSRSTVDQHNGTQIVHYDPTNADTTPGWGYYFQNDIKCLDTLGDWYYDTNARRLNVYFGGATPSSYVVKAATIHDIIDINGKSYININNIAFEGANQRGIRPYNNSHHLNIQFCTFVQMGLNAVSDGPEYEQSSCQDVVIDSCEIEQALSAGVKLTECAGVTITNNNIYDTGLFPGHTRAIWGDYNGIHILGCTNSGSTNNLVEYNNIYNSGYCGIFGKGSEIIVRNNFIDGHCLTKSDGGGIYWYISNQMTNRIFENNIVMNGVGTYLGTNSTHNDGSVGIYFDDNSANVTVRNNVTINNSRSGVYFHNCINITAYGNVSYNNPIQMHVHADGAGDDVRTHSITGNILVNKTDEQIHLAAYSDKGDSDISQFFTTLNQNYYIDAFRSLGLMQLIGNNDAYHDVVSLYLMHGWEDMGKISPLISTPVISPTVIAGNKASVTSATWNGSDVLISIGNVISGTYYRISVDVTSVSSQPNIRISLLRNGGAYDLIGAYAYLAGQPTNPTQVVYIKAKASDLGILLFRPATGVNFTLTNLNVVRISGTEVNRDSHIQVVYNRTKFSASQSLPGTYVNKDNVSYNGSITLPPFTGAALLRTGETTGNMSPVVSVGSSQNITLPTSTASLSGSATDSDGSVVSYLWTKESGPSSFTISTPSAQSTSVTGLVQGTYVFRLTATDNIGATGYALQTVVVNAAPAQALEPTNIIAGRKKM